jgi:RimJ/RimL family protein N-acetyltransferase
MIVLPFATYHLRQLRLQQVQRDALGPLFDTQDYGDFLARSEAYTCVHDGRVVACVGIVEAWKGRGMAWALLGNDVGADCMRAITKKTMRWMKEQDRFTRIETTCDVDFPQAHRWLRLMGFSCEAECMRKFSPDGRDQALYARVS